MSCESGAERAARVRITAAWNKWREISSLLVNKTIPLRNRAAVYKACVRPVMLYGADTWATTLEIERKIRSSDQRMLRHMAGVRLEDRVSSEVVRERCGVKDIIEELKLKRLRWFGHVRRREGDHILRRAADMEVQRGVGATRGGTKKTWIGCVGDDMGRREIGIEEVGNRGRWEILIRQGERNVRRVAVNDRDERMRARERRLADRPTP